MSKNVTILLRTPDRRSWNAALDKLVEEMGKADLYCGDTPYECCAGEKVGQVYGLIEALKVRSKK